jgi:hypothetical protein
MESDRHSLPSACCDGGPHLLLPRNLVPYWNGVAGAVGADFAGTDYGRACASPEPASIIGVASGQGLVVAGSPPFTYWLGHAGDMSGDLVVPQYWTIDFDASHLREAVAQARGLVDLGILFENESEDCVLLAASDSGPDWVYGVSSVRLRLGRYRVFAGESSLGQDLEVEILRLIESEAPAV